MVASTTGFELGRGLYDSLAFTHTHMHIAVILILAYNPIAMNFSNLCCVQSETYSTEVFAPVLHIARCAWASISNVSST